MGNSIIFDPILNLIDIKPIKPGHVLPENELLVPIGKLLIPGLNPTLALLFKAIGTLLLVVGVATIVIYYLRHRATQV